MNNSIINYHHLPHHSSPSIRTLALPNDGPTNQEPSVSCVGSRLMLAYFFAFFRDVLSSFCIW